MIPSPKPISADDIARHYDDLDFFYRDVWGHHLHHGVWEDGHPSSVEDATERLLEVVTTPLGISEDDRIADIGCGYGGGSRWIAQRYGAEVSGFTLSHTQAVLAHHHAGPSRGDVHFHLQDWLTNQLPKAHFDVSVAIESLAHMTDKTAFFRQLFRTLRPGGRAGLACWLASEDLTWIERRLIGKICDEGRLPGLGTLTDYLALARAAGFEITKTRNLTLEVEPTWWIIARRALRGLCTDPRYLRFLLKRGLRERIFALTLPRMIFAYRTGALNYALLWLKKPR